MFSVVILAAGLGKRMQMPDKPKVLAEINSKPLIYYVLNVATALKTDKIVLIVGHKKELLIDYVQNTFGEESISNIYFATQEEQLGTGHATLCAFKELADYTGDVLVLAGDAPLLRLSTLDSFIKKHYKTGADISVLSATADNSTGYGRIVRDINNNFVGIVEEKDATEEEKQIKEINSGIYFLSSNLLFDLLKKVKNNNKQNEYYLTDIISIARNNSYKVAAANIANFNEIQGINSHEQLLEVKNIMNF